LGWWISPCYGPFLLGEHFETYELFLSFSNFFPGHGKLWITETADNESVDMEARLSSQAVQSNNQENKNNTQL
jgi:hypothetical protein